MFITTGLTTGRKHSGGDRARHSGFTLVELMILILLASVFITLGVPGFQTQIKNNRLQTELYALRATLSNARSEAMTQHWPVVVCESANGTSCATNQTSWTTGYLAFVDLDDDKVVDTDEQIIVQHTVGQPRMTLVFRDSGGTAKSFVRFRASGNALDSSGTFTFCDDRGANFARAVTLGNSGENRTAIDSANDDDDIVNSEGGGGNVTCPAPAP